MTPTQLVSDQHFTLEAIIELLKTELRLCMATGKEISVDQGFMELGLDSLELLDLSMAVEEKLGINIEPDQLFEHSTITKLARFLYTQVNPDNPIPEEPDWKSDTIWRDQVAIIGMGCRFPGGINHPDDLWQLLIKGEDALAKPPKNRIAYQEPMGGFLESIEYFDANYFGISPREAIYIDPQQRILLEVIWDALRNASIEPESLQGTKTGVFIGISNNDYRRCLNQSTLPPSLFFSTGNATSVASGRVSYLLGVTGPSISIDTACSSSLVATHLACQSLKNGECDLAIVAGVNLILEPTHTDNLLAAGMLSPDGRCKSFDVSANGFVRSEGCGVVLLARGETAMTATPLAFIKGSAINQDGHSSGLSAPNINAQHEVITAALHNAGVTAAQVDYVEAHGSGTTIGDTIELNAIKRSYAPREKQLHIGSIKASIGHTEAVAGMAGLIKTTLALIYQQLPKQLHYQQKNSRVKLTEEEGSILSATQPWASHTQQRMAGVSSFGFSGTNCHMIVAESPQKLLNRSYKAYSYQRDYYWPERKIATGASLMTPTRHPILQHTLRLANGDVLYTGSVSLTTSPYLNGHHIFSHVLFPGAAFCELLLAVAVHQFGHNTFSLEQFELSKALIITEKQTIECQALVKSLPSGLEVSIYAKNQHETAWVHYCSVILKSELATVVSRVDHTAMMNLPSDNADHFYAAMNSNGIHYSPAFQVIKHVQYADHKVLASLEVNQEQSSYYLHPTLLDGCFQTAVIWAFLNGKMIADEAYLPVAIHRLTVYQPFPKRLVVSAEILSQSTSEVMQCNITMMNRRGDVIAIITGLIGKRADKQAILRQLNAHSASASIKTTHLNLPELLKTIPKKRWLKVIKEFVRKEVSAVLNSTDELLIDMDKGFLEMGMDSLMLLDLQIRIQDAVDKTMELNRTAGFDFPTANALSDKIYAEFLNHHQAEQPVATSANLTPDDSISHLSVDELIMKIDN
jgi:acyl transferase domain-containing protein/acyl carrier protein